MNVTLFNRLPLLLALALPLVSCDKGEEQTAEDGGIKLLFIGQITDTANATSTPEAAAGIKAAVSRINDNGGLLGKPISLIICDDKADPNEAAKCARKAVREKVVATVGNVSNHGNIILPVLESASIVSIGHNPISSQDFANPVAVPLQGGAPTAVAGATKLLYQQGARRIRVATVDSPAGSHASSFAKAALTGTDTTLVGATLIPVGAPDYAGYATALIADTDGILISTNADQAARIIVALRQAGATQMLAVPALAVPPATRTQLGDKANGLLVASTVHPTKSTDRLQFQEDMAKYAKDAKLTEFSLRAWLAVTVLERALIDAAPTQGSQIDSKTVLTILGKLDNKVVSDLIPPLTTTQERAAPFNRLFINQVMHAQITDGELVLISNEWHN